MLDRLERLLDDNVWLGTNLIIERLETLEINDTSVLDLPFIPSVFLSATALLCRGWLLNDFVPRAPKSAR